LEISIVERGFVLKVVNVVVGGFVLEILLDVGGFVLEILLDVGGFVLEILLDVGGFVLEIGTVVIGGFVTLICKVSRGLVLWTLVCVVDGGFVSGILPFVVAGGFVLASLVAGADGFVFSERYAIPGARPARPHSQKPIGHLGPKCGVNVPSDERTNPIFGPYLPIY